MEIYPLQAYSGADQFAEHKSMEVDSKGWQESDDRGRIDANRRFWKRKDLFDLWMGRLLLVVTSPLLLFLFFLVKLTSPGPGFYRQVRVGLDGKKFEIIKLRSMVDNAEKPGVAVWSTKGDARVTLLGRVLRKLHLDELPQLWNVSVGDMSLVGPRPERPKICEGLAEQIDGYYRRNCIKPGVTGLAQINLPPDESVEDVRRKQILDLYYIEHAGYWLDARMLVATAMRMVGVKGLIVMKLMGLCRLEVVKREELNTELFSNDPPSAHCTLRLHESHSGMHTSESQVESRQQCRSDR